jgi:hypothetical protein
MQQEGLGATSQMVSRQCRVRHAELSRCSIPGQGDRGGCVRAEGDRSGGQLLRDHFLCAKLVVAAATAGEVAGAVDRVYTFGLSPARVVDGFAVATRAWLLRIGVTHQRMLPRPAPRTGERPVWRNAGGAARRS